MMGGRWDDMALTQYKYLYYHYSSSSISNLQGRGLIRSEPLGQSSQQSVRLIWLSWWQRGKQFRHRCFYWCLSEKAIIHIFKRVAAQCAGHPAFQAISKQQGNYGCIIICLPFFCLFGITMFAIAANIEWHLHILKAIFLLVLCIQPYITLKRTSYYLIKGTYDIMAVSERILT